MAAYRFVTLLDDLSADQDGEFVPLPELGLGRQNRFGAIVVIGDLGGGEVTIQGSHQPTVYAVTLRTPNDNQLVFTLADYQPAQLMLPNIRARLVGSSGASGVSAFLVF